MIDGKDFARLESLQELIWAIDTGLDIEFYLYGTRYNISTNGTPFIAICPDGDGIYYQNAQDMIEHHAVNGKSLKDVWQDFEVIGM